MTHWAQLPCDRILAALQGDAMDFTRHHHAALNTAIVDRTRLATALSHLLTAVQLECPQASIRLAQAETEAVEALQSVGGIVGASEPDGAPV